MSAPRSVVSLFSGAGGMDLGFEQAGFTTLWANDVDKDACATHRMWSKAEVVHGDVSKIAPATLPDCDVVLGGFPCQGFSLAGPRRLDDGRNSLYRHFVDVVEAKQPKAFVAENVKGILTLGGGRILEAILADFAAKGYEVFPTLVNATDFGVPQDRHRVIMVGIHQDLHRSFVFPDREAQRTTLRLALQGVPAPSTGDVCTAAFSSRYMSRNRRRGWDDVSYTIPAMAKQCPLHPSSPEMRHIGTDLWEFGDGVTRRMSWMEAAAVQTFPLGMEFAGDLTSKYRQIGNAVPVQLAAIVAAELREVLRGA